MSQQNDLRIDKDIFVSTFAVLLAVCLPLIFFPEQGESVVKQLFNITTKNLGFVYIWAGLLALGTAGYLIFSKYGGITLGDQGETPEFRTFSWASMLFCAGIGAGIMYWGVIEGIYYYNAPPLGYEKGSWQAAELAATYGIFHWGPVAWAMYSLPAVPIGYSYFVRKKPVLKISEVCRGVLGDKVDGPLGKAIDVIFLFGIVGGASTSLGLGTPLAAACVSKVFGIEQSSNLTLALLVLVSIIFTVSSYLGLKKGIEMLSRLNITVMIGILLFVLVAGPTLFIIKMSTTSIGVLLKEFVRMATWMDPVGNSGFVEGWTVFYWAWWMSYAPFMGLFIARISRGRTIRNMLSGALFWGSFGCAVSFFILGNFSLYLQVNEILPVADMLGKIGAPATIVEILSSLPLGGVVVFLFAVVCVIFMATTFDSASYTMAAVTTHEIKEGQEPARYNRLFWAISISLLPTALIIIDGPLSTLQTTSIVFALPVTFVLVTVMVSFFKDMAAERQERDAVEKRSQA